MTISKNGENRVDMTRRVDVTGFTKPLRYPKTRGMIDTFGQNKESFPQLLSIFFDKDVKTENDPHDDEAIIKEKKISHFYKEANRKSSFRADLFFNFEKRKIVFEYNGWHHYTDHFKMDRDERKKDAFQKQNIEIYTFPYYLQLTKDIAKYLFKKNFGVFSEEKYKKALEKIYRVENETEILAPGWHTTRNTPANFIPKGIKKLINEVHGMPKSTKSQLVHSLKLYMARSNGRTHMIVPENNIDFDDFMNHKIEKEDLNYFFQSDV